MAYQWSMKERKGDSNDVCEIYICVLLCDFPVDTFFPVALSFILLSI